MKIALSLVMIACLGLVAGCGTVHSGPFGQKVLGTVPSLDVQHVQVPPVVDGVLGEKEWEQAALITCLSPALGESTQAAITEVPTTVRVMWDEQYLYVGFDCVDSHITSSGGMKHDDPLFQEDVCEVFLDGVGDGRQYVEIQVNPEGVNTDCLWLLTADPEYDSAMRFTKAFCETDRWKITEWDMTGLRTVGRRTARGWSVEMAIPAETLMKRLGSREFRPGIIRANFMRYDWSPSVGGKKAKFLQQNWSPVLWGNPHNSPARMGFLNLISPAKGSSK